MHEHGCRFIMMVPTTLFKSVRSSSMFQHACSNMHEQACQQPCSSLPAQPCSSQSTTMFKSASSTMFKPVNNHVQAGQLNHVQACQQQCSNWPAQPCMVKPVNNHVQAGQLNHVQADQLNHVQAGQLNHVQAGQLYQPCSSLSTGKNKLCVVTCTNEISTQRTCFSNLFYVMEIFLIILESNHEYFDHNGNHRRRWTS